MEQRLSVIIEADVKRFNQALAQAEKNLKNAENVFRRSTGEVSRLENALAKLSNQFKAGAISEKDFQKQAEAVSKALLQQRTVVQNSQSEIKRLGSAINSIQASRATTQTGKLGGQMSKLTGQVRGANGVALEFNRIIQDAPFGLIGIGNNLQQLAGNFSNVSKAAGGTRKAILASLSALLTPANLALLAVSALTAGFTAYQMGAFDFASKTNKATAEAEKFAEELDNFKKSLDGVASSQLKASKSAKEEEIRLKALFAQATNVNLTYNQRISAVEELQKRYPDYFGKLTNEQILTGKVGTAVKDLTANLLESAKARAALSRIVENSSKALDIEIRALNRANDILKLRGALEKAQAKERERQASKTSGQGLFAAENISSLGEVEGIQNKIDRLVNAQLKDVEEISKLNQENAKLQERTNVALEKGGTLVEDLAKGTKELANESQKDFFKFLKEDIKEIEKGFEDTIFKTFRDNEIKNIDLGVDFDFDDALKTNEYDQKILGAIEKSKQLEAVVSQTGIQISNAFANAFAQGLNSGENFFDSLEKGFKALLKQLAAQLATAAFLKILAGLTTGGISTAFAGAAASNPFGALFGGFRASGGPVSSGKSYVVGEQGPEMFIPKTSGTIIPNGGMSTTTTGSSPGSMTVHVVGKIMNDAIVLSNQRGSRANNRYYGINE